MDLYIIGQMIREFRRRKFISQEELCDGLCSVSTLSRIENSQNTPNKKLVEAFLTRIGVSSNVANVPMSVTDMKRWFVEQKMNESIGKNNFEFQDSLEEYEQIGEMDFLEQQTLLFYTGIYKFHHETDLNIALGYFNKALLLSLPNYKSVQDLRNHLLSNMEIKILNNIALSNFNLENQNEAISILEFLREYYSSKLLDSNQVATGFPLILYNLTNWKSLTGQQEEALKLADEGIDVCTKYSRLCYFPYHIFNKGWILCKLGRIEEGKKHLRNALTNLAYTKSFDEIKYDIPAINSEFNLDFKVEDFLPPNY